MEKVVKTLEEHSLDSLVKADKQGNVDNKENKLLEVIFDGMIFFLFVNSID